MSYNTFEVYIHLDNVCIMKIPFYYLYVLCISVKDYNMDTCFALNSAVTMFPIVVQVFLAQVAIDVFILFLWCIVTI